MNTKISLKIDKLLIKMNIDMPVSPTIADVVMWLYENHGIWIFCDKTIIWFWTIQKQTNEYIQQEDLDETFSNGFNSPTEAYEAAILFVLKNLI